MKLWRFFVFAVVSSFGVLYFAEASPAPQNKLALSASISSDILNKYYLERPLFDSQMEELVRSRPVIESDFDKLVAMSRLVYYVGFILLDEKKDRDIRLELFDYGVSLSERARNLMPNRVEGHYWYAVTRGGYGLAKGIFASLGAAKDMRDALDKAIQIDGTFNQGGPYRVRGRMYFKLPGGIISFGDNDKALADLSKAIQIAPQNRLNYIYLSEVLAKEKSKKDALQTLKKAESLPDSAGQKEEVIYKREMTALQKKFSK